MVQAAAQGGRIDDPVIARADDSRHGHHPIKGLRKSIIINHVTSEWRDKWELA